MIHVNGIFAACECFVNESVIYLKNGGIAIQIKLHSVCICVCLVRIEQERIINAKIYKKKCNLKIKLSVI